MEEVKEKAAEFAAKPMTDSPIDGSYLVKHKTDQAMVVKHILEYLAEQKYSINQSIQALEFTKKIMLDCTILNQNYPLCSEIHS